MGNCLSADNRSGSTASEFAQECAASLQPTQQDCAAEKQKKEYESNSSYTTSTSTLPTEDPNVSTSGQSGLSALSCGRPNDNRVSKQAKLSQQIPERAPCRLLSQMVDGSLKGVSTHPGISISELKSCAELGDLLHAFTKSMDVPLVLMELYCLEQQCYIAKSTPEGTLQWHCVKVPSNLPILDQRSISVGNPQESAQQVDPMWADKGLVSYIAAPLQASNGQLVGALCFLDVKDFKIDSALWRLLNNFSDLAMRVIESHNGLYGRKPDRCAAAASSRRGKLPWSLGKTQVIGSPMNSGEPQFTPSVSSRKLASVASRAVASQVDASHATPFHAGTSRGSSAAQPSTYAQTSTSSRTGTSCQNDNSTQKRDTIALEHSCSIFLDVADSCCRILHVGSTWKTWTGQDRITAQGCRLEDLIVAAGVGRPPVHWPGVFRALSKGRHHVLHCMAIADPQQGEPKDVDVATHTFDISFIPACQALLDSDVAQFRSPTHMPEEKNSHKLRRFYFARLHLSSSQPTYPLHLVTTFSSELPGQSQHQSNQGQFSQLSQRICGLPNVDAQLKYLFSGMTLSAVLGKGSYGVAYLASWHDTNVVTKIQTQTLTHSSDRDHAPLEIALGLRVNHPNVVQTLAHAVLPKPKPMNAPTSLNLTPSMFATSDWGTSHTLPCMPYSFEGSQVPLSEKSSITGRTSLTVPFVWHENQSPAGDTSSGWMSKRLSIIPKSARSSGLVPITILSPLSQGGGDVRGIGSSSGLVPTTLPSHLSQEGVDDGGIGSSSCLGPTTLPSHLSQEGGDDGGIGSSSCLGSITLPSPLSQGGGVVRGIRSSSVLVPITLPSPLSQGGGDVGGIGSSSCLGSITLPSPLSQGRGIVRRTVSSSALGSTAPPSPLSPGGEIIRGTVRSSALNPTNPLFPLSQGGGVPAQTLNILLRRDSFKSDPGVLLAKQAGAALASCSLTSMLLYPFPVQDCTPTLQVTHKGVVNLSMGSKALSSDLEPAWPSSWSRTSCNALPMGNTSSGSRQRPDSSTLVPNKLSTRSGEDTTMAPLSADLELSTWGDIVPPCATAYEEASDPKETMFDTLSADSQISFWSEFSTDEAPCATAFEEASTPKALAKNSARVVRGMEDSPPQGTMAPGSELDLSASSESACSAKLRSASANIFSAMSTVHDSVSLANGTAHVGNEHSAFSAMSTVHVGNEHSAFPAMSTVHVGNEHSSSLFPLAAPEASGVSWMDSSDLESMLYAQDSCTHSGHSQSMQVGLSAPFTVLPCLDGPFSCETLPKPLSTTNLSDQCLATFASNLSGTESANKYEACFSSDNYADVMDLSTSPTISPPTSLRPACSLATGCMELLEVVPCNVLDVAPCHVLDVGPRAVPDVAPCEPPGNRRAHDIPAYDYEEYPITLRSYIVLEHCDRGCLQDAISLGWLRTHCHEAAPIDYHRVLHVAMGMACGLENLHLNNVVHADLSGSNVLLQSDDADSCKPLKMEDNAWACLLAGGTGRDPIPSQYQKQAYRLREEGSIVMEMCDYNEEVDYTTALEAPKNLVAKIADFGKSIILAPGEMVTTQGSTTVTHAAPEMLARGELSHAADVYSFGVLLWSMCTGRQPWEDMSYAQLVSAVTLGTSELQWPCSVPPCLSELGRSCLQRTPQLRPTFTSVRATLEVCILH